MNIVDNVLLVEDNLSDVQLTLHVIADKNAACRVHVARDGEQAIERIYGVGQYAGTPKVVFELVLLDLKLPKVNGFEVLKHIKDDPATRALPVVVLSSSNQPSDVDTSYELGANGYVQKPVSYEEFQETIGCITSYWLDVNLGPSNALSRNVSKD